MLNIILIVSVILCVVSAGTPPVGNSYCGAYGETDRIKVTIVSPSVIGITGRVHGSLISCGSESVSYLPSGVVTFPSILSSSDCLGSLLKSQNINISLLQVTYDSVTDSATVVGPNGVQFVLKNDCQFFHEHTESFFAGPLSPSGSYCGSYQTSIKGKVTFVTASNIKITGTVFGNDASCTSEAVAFVPATSSLNFPNVKSTSDCLGNLLRGYSVDPAAVKVTYVNAKDLLKVSFGTTVFNMSKCSTMQVHYGEDIIEKKNPVVKIGDPSGSYCGSYSDIVTNLKATVNNATDFSLVATVYGSSVSCVDEVAKYYPSNNSVEFPTINNSNDCLGSQLISYGIDPSGLMVTYDPSANSLSIGVAGIAITLTPAQCAFRKLYVPSGTYCGSVPNVITVKATVISLTVVSISGSIYGTVNPPCPREAVAILPNNTIKFTNIDAPTDCLGALLRSYSINPDGLNARYFPSVDLIELTVIGNSFNMSKKAC